jgi:D-hydroxyproline dehydrogenase subunit alpha
MRELDCDVLVIGAGPGGIAAATTAAVRGARVCLIDMQARPGGQIWRGQWSSGSDARARCWLQQLRESAVHCEFSARVVDWPRPGQVLADGAAGGLLLNYRKVVIATGARERQLPFPGWTLPGVCAAGGLQVMVKDGLSIGGQRVVLAGSGPLLLAAAASLKAQGAHVVAVAEQTSAIARLASVIDLARSPRHLGQAAHLLWQLRKVPKPTSTWPLRAEGDVRLRRVVLQAGSRQRVIECDWLAVGFGLVPNVDVASAFGCDLVNGAVSVDADQRSSVDAVFAVGESTGIGGIDQALAQGVIAGHGVTDGPCPPLLRRQRDRALRFARNLERRFGLNPALRELAAANDTPICRCENVTAAALAECDSPREARLHARLGMGWCQGRICGPAVEFVRAWSMPPPRPPLAPVTIGKLSLSVNSSTRQKK